LKTKKLILISILALGALLLSACSGQTVANSWHGLAADSERAYVSAGSLVYAVDLKNGAEVWRYPEKADASLLFFAPPVLTADGQLLMGSAGKTHSLTSLDPATGKEKWARAFTGAKGIWMASPLVLNDKIYAPNADGFLYILDMNGVQAQAPIEIGGTLWSAPVTDGKFIYLTSLDHHVHVVDLAKGTVQEAIDLGGAIAGSPAAGQGGAYVGSFASTVELVTSSNAHETIARAETRIWGAPVVDGETLYFADLNGNVYSLDLASGKQNWTVQPNGPVVASLLIVGDHIYVASEADPSSELGTLIALDRDGRTVWEKEVGGKLYTTPVVSGDLILVAPYQAEFTLAAYDAEGRQAWTFTPAK
jgi:outer membrane protein assembly factor BamB